MVHTCNWWRCLEACTHRQTHTHVRTRWHAHTCSNLGHVFAKIYFIVCSPAKSRLYKLPAIILRQSQYTFYIHTLAPTHTHTHTHTRHTHTGINSILFYLIFSSCPGACAADSRWFKSQLDFCITCSRFLSSPHFLFSPFPSTSQWTYALGTVSLPLPKWFHNSHWKLLKTFSIRARTKAFTKRMRATKVARATATTTTTEQLQLFGCVPHIPFELPQLPHTPFKWCGKWFKVKPFVHCITIRRGSP